MSSLYPTPIRVALTQEGDAEDLLDAAITRRKALLARPAIAAIVAHAQALTNEQRQQLHDAYFRHYGTCRASQNEAVHRLRHLILAESGDDQEYRDILQVTYEVWAMSNGQSDRYGAAHAAADAAFAALAGDRLTLIERDLFAAPWRSAGGAA